MVPKNVDLSNGSVFSNFLSFHKHLHTLKFSSNGISPQFLTVCIQNVCSFIKELTFFNMQIDLEVIKALSISPYFKNIKKIVFGMCLDSLLNEHDTLVDFFLLNRKTLCDLSLLWNFLSLDQHIYFYRHAYVKFECIEQINIHEPEKDIQHIISQFDHLKQQCNALCETTTMVAK